MCVATVLVDRRPSCRCRARPTARAGGPLRSSRSACIAVELLAYQNHARLARFDPESPTPRVRRRFSSSTSTATASSTRAAARCIRSGAPRSASRRSRRSTCRSCPRTARSSSEHIVPQHGLFLEVGAQTRAPFKVQPSRARPALGPLHRHRRHRCRTSTQGVKARYPLVFTDRQSHVEIYENRHAVPARVSEPGADGARGAAPGASRRRITRTDDAELLAAAQAAGIPSARDAGATVGAARVTRYDNTEVHVDGRRAAAVGARAHRHVRVRLARVGQREGRSTSRASTRSCAASSSRPARRPSCSRTGRRPGRSARRSRC